MDAAQGGCELGLITGKEDRFYGLEGVQAHSGRAAPGKKAKDHLFPEVGVCSSLADHLKFGQPLADLRPAFDVSPDDVLNCYGFSFSFHRIAQF